MGNDSSGPRVDLMDLIPLRVPLCVYIDVTNACNFTCPWCPTGNHLQLKVTHNSGVMDFSLFQKVVREFQALIQSRQQKIKHLAMFHLGEPLIHKRYCEMVKLAKDAQIAEKITVSTNGSLLDEKAALGLIDSGMDLVSVSMYGCSNEDYKILNKRFDFDTVINNAKRLKELRDQKGSETPKVYFKYFQRTPEVLAKKEFLMGYCDHIAFEEPFNWNSIYSEKTGEIVKQSQPNKMKHCSSPWYVMTVSWDGTVLVCCSDWSWHTKVGDVKVQSVQEVWDGDALYEFRKRIVEGRQNENPACRGCTFYKVLDEANSLDELIKTNPEKVLMRTDGNCALKA